MSEKHLTLEQFAKSLRNSITNKSSITVKSDVSGTICDLDWFNKFFFITKRIP